MNKKIILTLVAVVATFTAMAQGRMDMCINEVMVQNNDSANQNGKCSAWIELFNASYGTNAIEKMFVTTFKQDYIQNYFKEQESKSNKKRNVLLEELRNQYPDKVYEIPRGDVDTKIKPRSHVVFYADGDTTSGTFHLSFTLASGTENYVALYDVNGDLVDEVIVPSSLQAGQSFARTSEGLPSDMHPDGNHSFDAGLWSVRDGSSVAKAITPGKFNVRPINENIEKFKEEDPSGVLLTIMSMGVVFSALLLLYILFKLFGKAFSATGKEKKDEEPATQPAAQVADAQEGGDNDEAIAALCMALYQHLNAHDEESGILTFDHSHEAHSAWGSKGNLLLHMPERHENH